MLANVVLKQHFLQRFFWLGFSVLCGASRFFKLYWLLLITDDNFCLSPTWDDVVFKVISKQEEEALLWVLFLLIVDIADQNVYMMELTL